MTLGEDPSSEFIDNEGRLFGYINIVDAAIVALLIVTVVAGAAFVVLSSPSTMGSETASTHATLDLGVQPPGIATAIDENDTYEPTPQSTLTITDIYRVPEDDGVRTFARVNLTGPSTESGMIYDGAPPRLGRDVLLTTSRYNTTGDITAVGESRSLPLADRTVTLRTTLPSYRADEFSVGQQIRLDGRTIATIDDVTRYDGNGSSQLFLEASLRVYAPNGATQFGSTLVRDGATVRLPGEETLVPMTVERLDGFERTSTTVRATTTVPADTARSIAAGDEFFVGDQSVARIDSLAIYDTNATDRKEVYANVTLQTVQIGERPQFGSTIVHQGVSVPFQTADYDLDFRVDRVGQGLEMSSTQVLVTDTVSSDVAANITTGDRYIVAGQSIATVESATTYGTGDPDRRDVYLGLTLETLDHGELPRFGSAVVRRGATIPFNTAAYELDGRIQRVGTTELPGTPITGNATIEIRNIEPSLADNIEVGMTDRSGDQTLARIISVERENATVVLTSDDGQIYRREHPVNQDVTITVELALRETTAGLRFKGRILQQGQPIRLNLGSLTVEGVLVSPIHEN